MAAFTYADVWQRKNLVLVSIPLTDSSAAGYVEPLVARAGMLESEDSALVVTADSVVGIPSPGVVIADRWGEIWFIQGAERAEALPSANDLVEWLHFVRMQCPECQGEAP